MTKGGLSTLFAVANKKDPHSGPLDKRRCLSWLELRVQWKTLCFWATDFLLEPLCLKSDTPRHLCAAFTSLSPECITRLEMKPSALTLLLCCLVHWSVRADDRRLAEQVAQPGFRQPGFGSQPFARPGFQAGFGPQFGLLGYGGQPSLGKC